LQIAADPDKVAPGSRLPLYFRPRLAEGLPGRLQIRAFAGENPPDLRRNGCTHERQDYAHQYIVKLINLLILGRVEAGKLFTYFSMRFS
jgi:hypothetical protein